jgi:hypothetical protein
MRKLIFVFILAAIATNLKAQNPVTNPGFELWTGTEPDFWATSNAPPAYAVTQTNNFHSGSFAAEGEVTGLLPPVLISTDSIGGTGFPITQAYANCTFWYRDNLVGLDEFEAGVLFYGNTGNVNGNGAITISASAGAYTQATIPVSTFGGNTPVECIISFRISNPNGTPHMGSFFIVDDVALTNPLNAEEYISAVTHLVVYPNPASESISFKLPPSTDKNFEITLSDIAGRIVFKRSLDIATQGALDARSFSEGMYFLKVQSENKIYSQKVAVSR